MSQNAFVNALKSVRKGLKKHSPEILTGIGIAGMVTSTIMAVKATPKAMMLIEEKAIEERVEELEPVEVVKTAWKCYIPTVVIAGISIGCLVGASSVNLRRNAALAAAYSLSESALKEYSEKVLEEVGEKKERAIRDAVAKDKAQEINTDSREIIVTEKGNTLCLDVISGRLFYSDIDKLRKIENELNRRMRTDMYISLNEFYDELGLDHTKLGNDLGWHIDKGYIDLKMGAQLTKDEKPCIVVDYTIAPIYDYDK